MNIELDLVRELRAPVSGPSTEVVHRQKEQLVQYIDSTTSRTRPRSRVRIAAGVAIPVLGVAGVAAAAGLIPSAVTDRFDGLGARSGGEVAIDADQATIVAEAQAAGYQVELWNAPTDQDRQCLYIRSIWELDGAVPAENGPVGCFDALPVVVDPTNSATDGSDLLGVLDVFPLGHPTTSGGVSPGPIATAITGAVDVSVGSLDIQFRDGQHVEVDVTDADGWFAQVLEDDVTQPDANGVLANPPVSVTLRGDDGEGLATLVAWSQLQATAISQPS